MALATPHTFLPSSRHKPAFSCGSPQDSRSAGLCRAMQGGGGGRLPVAQHRRSALSSDNGSASSASSAAADPETVRLVTAATILSASPGSSSSGDAAAAAAAGLALESNDEDGSGDGADRLSLLDELVELDADSLSLVVGILRQRQPLEAEEADVELSERLRDFLLLLKQRPSKLISAAAAGGTVAAAAAAAISSSSNSEAALAEGFWAGPDEWQDVRCALMSIGINASVDEEDDEEEGVWAQEEDGGPAVRRTRLLQRLPKLDAATAAGLSAFLAEAQQRPGQAAPSATASGTASSGSGSNGRTAAADRQQQAAGVSEEEERWWASVTAAYSRLWQQARAQQLQQRPPATEASG